MVLPLLKHSTHTHTLYSLLRIHLPNLLASLQPSSFNSFNPPLALEPCQSPDLLSDLPVEDTWTGILFAVPKRKTSKSKKKLRSAGKHLRPVQSFKVCTTCGKSHLHHHLCPFCHPFNNWTVNKDKERKLRR